MTPDAELHLDLSDQEIYVDVARKRLIAVGFTPDQHVKLAEVAAAIGFTVASTPVWLQPYEAPHIDIEQIRSWAKQIERQVQTQRARELGPLGYVHAPGPNRAVRRKNRDARKKKRAAQGKRRRT